MSWSCETGRRAPYPVDLRHWQRFAMELKMETIAKNVCVSIGTVHNICELFKETGSVESRSNKDQNTRVLSEYDELQVIGLLLESPNLFLREVCRKVSTLTGVSISESTICRILQRHGLTRKKTQQVALQRSNIFRGDFMAEMHFFGVDQLVWLDETGCDRRDHIRKMGYAMKGESPVCNRILHRGQRISAVMAMCSEGVIAVEFEEGTEKFVNFITTTLIPEMHQFDGSSPNSVLIMDNCTIHHVEPALDVLRSAGILTMFLPPYSPDLNPAEELFSQVKYYLKEHDEILQSIGDPKPILQAAFDNVDSEDCLGWIHHSGYI